MLAHDVDSAAHSVEISFLTYKIYGIWDFPKKKDQSIVAFKYVFWDNEKAQKLFRLAMIQINSNIIIILFLTQKNNITYCMQLKLLSCLKPVKANVLFKEGKPVNWFALQKCEKCLSENDLLSKDAGQRKVDSLRLSTHHCPRENVGCKLEF